MLTLLEITEIFHRTFSDEYNIILEGGFPEPVYIPATDSQPAQIRFTRDYTRSALHEIAHWCVAGDARRKLPDYGYWYRPDGRNATEQSLFYQQEIKNQALERAFCEAAGIPFLVSADNLNGDPGDTESFSIAVENQLRHYRSTSFPKRAQRFIDAILQNHTDSDEFASETRSGTTRSTTSTNRESPPKNHLSQ